MRIGFASDYAGFECKERLRSTSADQGHSTKDFSTGDRVRADHQDATGELASAIQKSCIERGVLICSRAIGASVMANKYPGVRAALCHDSNSARLGVEDDGMNLLVMGAQAVTQDLASELADAFIDALYIPRERTFGIPPRRLGRVIEHIRNNLDKPLAVSELSTITEMSPSHFSKLFKVSTGLAPHQFVMQERINRSKELLRQDDARIVDVALGVGFENQAHFTTVFGNLVGMTPRRFQRSADDDLGVMYAAPLEVVVSR
jgi:ribose 5-phosphate isomerase B